MMTDYKRMFFRVRPRILATIRAYGRQNDHQTVRTVILSGLAQIGIPVSEEILKKGRKLRFDKSDMPEAKGKKLIPFSVLLPEPVWQELSRRALEQKVTKRVLIFEGLSRLGLDMANAIKLDSAKEENEDGREKDTESQNVGKY